MKILADSSRYSRRNLSDAIYGQSYARQCSMVHTGSNTLLRALWREHPERLRLAARNGRQVVRP